MSYLRAVVLLVCTVCALPAPMPAQQRNDNWQRVYTGDESLIDVDVSSLTFLAGRIIRVRFRTVFSKPESVNETPEKKYKSRIENIDFKLGGNQYRLRETTLLDANGKVVRAYEPSLSADWKAVKSGGIMEKLSVATRALPPFGNWKVVEYRFGEGATGRGQDLTNQVGTKVSLRPDSAAVGAKVCSSPDYESKPFDDQEFSRYLGISLQSIGLKASHADTIVIKCKEGWSPPQSLLVKLPEGGMLMLWDGVFLVLKKERY